VTKEQPANAVSTLLNENIRMFASAFCGSSRELFVDRDGKLVHPGEFGAFREAVTRDYLKAFVPQRMAVDTGFVVNANGRISSQCDIVIYDRTVTPLLQSANRQRFFPVESVCAVGEVKSIVTLSELKVALRKLANVKMLRDSLYEPSYIHCTKEEETSRAKFSPQTDEVDQFVTFLICERFDFNLAEHAQELLECYVSESPQIPVNLRHNFVLSIQNGLLTYLHPEVDALYPFPMKSTVVFEYDAGTDIEAGVVKGKGLRNRVILPSQGSFEHIRQFSTMFHQALSVVSVLFPDMGNYIASQDDVHWLDVDHVRGF
jgi:hypothetical protein